MEVSKIKSFKWEMLFEDRTQSKGYDVQWSPSMNIIDLLDVHFKSILVQTRSIMDYTFSSANGYPFMAILHFQNAPKGLLQFQRVRGKYVIVVECSDTFHKVSSSI